MEELKISYKRIEKEYLYLKKKWGATDEIFIKIEKPKKNELKKFVYFFFNKIPDDFAFDLLAEIGEYKELNISCIKEIFIKGDVACKVAVCLRDDLDEDLKESCNTSKESIVRSHYSNKILNNK